MTFFHRLPHDSIVRRAHNRATDKTICHQAVYEIAGILTSTIRESSVYAGWHMPLFKIKYSPAQGGGDGLRAIFCAQLGQYALYLHFNSAGCGAEFACDFLI